MRSCKRKYGGWFQDGLRDRIAVFLWILTLLAAQTAWTKDQTRILRVRHFSGPTHTRVVLDLDRAAAYSLKRVDNPQRVAINVARSVLQATAPVDVADGLIHRIRCNQGQSRAQVVLDLTAGFRVNAFVLPAEADRPHRIVVDVFRPEAATINAAAVPRLPAFQPTQRPFTVIIDPGHGGMDPGAIRNGLKEKDLVLDVAKAMARRIDSLPGYRAVLTRTTDYYPSLARRVEIAAEKGGDLFLSVHCNTHRRSQVSGMEVYFLSMHGASDHESGALAELENAADLVGMDPASPVDNRVMNILLDLKKTQVLQTSSKLAEHMLASAADGQVVKQRKIKQADFKVLRSLAMPSVLVEIAYLSNPEDRRLLADRDGRAQIAAMLVDGVMSWRQDTDALARLALDRPASWTRQYKVRRGDSLWKLAQQCGTTVAEISKRNELNSRSILIGQRLRLPEVYRTP